MRVAYADPPYPGRAHLYEGHPDYAGEVDHGDLLWRLSVYDGWALSTSAEALPQVLDLVRVWEQRPFRLLAWIKHTVTVGWEPVIVVSPANRTARCEIGFRLSRTPTCSSRILWRATR